MSLTVEDVLSLVLMYHSDEIQEPWAKNFMTNVNHYAFTGNQLSTKQAETLTKILTKLPDEVLGDIGYPLPEVRRVIDRSIFRKPLFQSVNIPREVRYLGRGMLAFRCKRDDTVVKRLSKIAEHSLMEPLHYIHEHRIRIVQITPSNLDDIVALIADHRFSVDDEVIEMLTLFKQTIDEKSRTDIVYDSETGVIAAVVVGNELLAAFIENELGGEPV